VLRFDLPESMACGATAQGEVVMRNSGGARWTRAAGYKLGTVDDSDPFYRGGTRVRLGDNDGIETGQTHTFRFELQAPEARGEYLSDWRMVHEGVHWFGGAAARRIRVECDDPPPPQEPPVPDLSRVVWLHTNVSRWRQNATLRSVRLDERNICLDYDASRRWPVRNPNGVEVVGNPWIFIWHDNRWYAGTWEWLRPGQTCKNRHAVAGSHIKRNPFGEHSGWQPSSGHTYYFMVSGLARDRHRNAQERTNLVRFVWP
jgi:hypothetical protein